MIRWILIHSFIHEIQWGLVSSKRQDMKITTLVSSLLFVLFAKKGKKAFVLIQIREGGTKEKQYYCGMQT